MHDVSLHDDCSVKVPVVDFPQSMRSILNDPEVMKHIMKELEGTTWRPITSTEEHESNADAVINDTASGVDGCTGRGLIFTALLLTVVTQQKSTHFQ
jgi:hypothetical protein